MMNNKLSESIFQKRVKRFKSIKRGYYSLIILSTLYFLSIISPLLINNKALIVKYNNQITFPALWDLLDFLPGITYPLYEAKSYGQNINKLEVDFRLLNSTLEEKNNGDFVIMPIYPYHPHEDLKDDLDEIYIDINNNNQYDLGEKFIDENNDGMWNENNPPTKPIGFSGRHILAVSYTHLRAHET